MRSAPSVVVNVTSAADTTLVPGKPGHRIHVWKGVLVNKHASQDVEVTFKCGSYVMHGAILLKANGGSWTLPFDGMDWMDCAAGGDLVLTTSAAGSVQGLVKFTNDQL